MQHILVGNLRVCQLLKESLILIQSDISFLSVPDSAKGIDCLPVKLDWIADELRELFDDFLNHDVLTEFS